MKLAAFAIASAALALGWPTSSGYASGGWRYFPQPPPEYRGDAMVFVHYVARDRIEEMCAGAEKRWLTDQVFACARGLLLILPNPCESPFRGYDGELACHELGHANGWRHEP